ncbi:MAG TPA: malate dehydrogenase [Candidatus Saccharimonadales bacterium]|nr:malate dehydrogenase [Candidatus Saccharimonadales bacterium]
MAKKVSIIGGGGNVGASCGLYLAEMGLADVVLVDVVEGLAAGKALDLLQSAPVRGFSVNLSGSHELSAIEGSDVVVVTAGVARKPGMSREDLLKVNADIARGAAEAIRKHAPNAYVLMVTNPLDVMAYLAWKVTGFPKNRVLGMAGVLDSARFRAFVALELGVSVQDVDAMVLGGHGDSMVPLPRYTTVCGIPIPELLPAETIAALSKRTANGGAEIVALLKTGSAFYAPGASAAQMAEALLTGRRRLLPASVLLEGEYGMKGLFIGVPIILGAKGVERIVPLKLSAEEMGLLQKSGEAVKKTIAELSL